MFKKFSIAAAVAAAAVLSSSVPALAAARDGVCDSGEFCYYYNSDFAGSVSDHGATLADYGATKPSCFEFKGVGAGRGECVKNNAASVWNRTGTSVTVSFNSDFAGPGQAVAAGAKVNLNAQLKNQNASHRPTVTGVTLSGGLYDSSGGRISCGFDGYVNTPGRHEGIDFTRGLDSPVHALVEGRVLSVVRGATGSGGLSTIAIYNATYDKTIIYLHTAPSSGLAVGQQVVRGQQIAVESWRGVSSAGSAHTHVEMRLGQRTRAAVSVGDSTLDNPNPTSFWTARGYSVR